MTTRIWKVFTFEAAHLLPLVPKEHQCSRLHGHSYSAKVTIGGTPVAGWLIDFAQMKAVWQVVAGGLDHSYLNDIEGLENPTAENLAAWLFSRLRVSFPPNVSLVSVEVSETPNSGAIVERA